MKKSDLAARVRTSSWAALAFWIPACMAFLTLVRFCKPFQRLLPLWVAKYWYFAFVAGAIIGTAAFVGAIARNELLSPGSKIGWILAVLVLGPVSCPAYWWFHIRTRR